MTKPKKSEKVKKPNNSEPKAKEGSLLKGLKDLAEKVVLTAKTVAPGEKAEPKTRAPRAPKAPKTGAVMGEATAPVETVQTAPAPSVLAAALANEASTPDLDEEVYLTDAEGRRYCRATDCDQVGLVDGYCRYHYLYFWKKIQVRKKILADGKLERYIEELTARYVDKFVELLRKDLRTEKDFLAAVQELELDDSSSGGSQQDEDEAKNYLEEISGVATESSSRDEDSY